MAEVSLLSGASRSNSAGGKETQTQALHSLAAACSESRPGTFALMRSVAGGRAASAWLFTVAVFSSKLPTVPCKGHDKGRPCA